MNKVFNFNLPVGNFEVFDDKPNFSNIVHIHQIHEDNILDYPQDSLDEKADGIRFSLKNTHKFAIKTADCIPIVILGKEMGVFIHAGWRGIHNLICISEKVKKIEPYYAFIGPSIQSDSFEVTSEFKDHFPDSKNFQQIYDKLYFNLQAELTEQLKKTFPNITIVDCAECTFKNSKYNSYRRDKTAQRNWNIFSI